MLQILVLAAFAATAFASYGANINYRSPSLHHPGMGISIRKVVKRNDPRSAHAPANLNFTHGVASGDPYPNSVILWTRCAPISTQVDDNSTVSGFVPLYNPVPIYNGTSGMYPPSNAPVCVSYKVATDHAMSKVVTQGKAYTSSDVDYTVKVEANGLSPFTWYYYQFSVCNSANITSPVGRTKTAPRPDDDVSQINLAIYSCSNFPFGYFNAFGNPARKNSVDYVLHVGDYIYEYRSNDYGYGWSIGRVPLPDRTIFTLYDYRTRYASYRTDFDLLLSHQQFPWIPVWDDHEVADNTYRDGEADLNNTEASFIADGGVSTDQRKMNAVRAYFEWMPLRQVEMDDTLRIWRNFQLGKLMDLTMLDTRQYDRSITDLYWNTDYVHKISNDAGRSMMGSRQENWFYNTLKESKARNAIWRVIGSQTVFSRINESISYGNVDPLDYDAWDGYQGNRNRTFNVLMSNNITNNIVISGDSHANWVSDLVWLDHVNYDPATGKGSLGVEFAGTAVSSQSPYGQNLSLAQSVNYSRSLIADNQELQWSEVYYRGYFELRVSKNQVDAEYFGMPTVINRNPHEISLANFTVMKDGNALKRVGGTTAMGGEVENGAVKFGKTVQTNITNSTDSGLYYISHNNQEDL